MWTSLGASMRLLILLSIFSLSFAGSPSHAQDVATNLQPFGEINNLDPDFTWNLVPGADKYEIRIATPQDEETALVNEFNISAPPYSVDNYDLQYDQVYHYWIRAWTGGVPGEWSDTQSFVVCNPAIVPSPLLPMVSNASPTPVFSWTAVPGAVSYDLLVFHRLDGSPELFRAYGLPTNSYQVPAERAFQASEWAYNWLVRSNMADGRVSDWSVFGSFVQLNPGEAPVPIKPIVRAHNSADLEFSWKASAGGVLSYTFELLNPLNRDGAPLHVQSGLTGTSTKLVGYKLTTGKVYEWRVKTHFADGRISPPSVVFSFKAIDEKAIPETIWPFGYVKNKPAVLEWSAGEGNVSWDIDVIDVSSQAIVHSAKNLKDTVYDLGKVKLARDKVYGWVVRSNLNSGKSEDAAPRDFKITNDDWDGLIKHSRVRHIQKKIVITEKKVGKKIKKVRSVVRVNDLVFKWTPIARADIKYRLVLRLDDGTTKTVLVENATESGRLVLDLDKVKLQGRKVYTWFIQGLTPENDLAATSRRRQFQLNRW